VNISFVPGFISNCSRMARGMTTWCLEKGVAVSMLYLSSSNNIRKAFNITQNDLHEVGQS